MAFNDALSDMLARIKNAHKANKSSTACFSSKLNTNVLAVLKDEGYIRDYENVEISDGISLYHNQFLFYSWKPRRNDETFTRSKTQRQDEKILVEIWW